MDRYRVRDPGDHSDWSWQLVLLSLISLLVLVFTALSCGWRGMRYEAGLTSMDPNPTFLPSA